MNEVEKWNHLLVKGEFPDRRKVLEGLKIEDVIRKPDNIKNSIFDELWHMTMWQNKIVLNDGEDAGEEFKKWNSDLSAAFPGYEPATQKEWDDLASAFIEGLEKAMSWCESPEKLDEKGEDNFTIRDSLYSLAIHNAYHTGKIIALRQRLGLWPPDNK